MPDNAYVNIYDDPERCLNMTIPELENELTRLDNWIDQDRVIRFRSYINALLNLRLDHQRNRVNPITLDVVAGRRMPILYRGDPDLTTLVWYHFNQLERNRGGRKKKTRKSKKRRRSTKKRHRK